MSEDLIYKLCCEVRDFIMPGQAVASGCFEFEGDDITYEFSYYGDVDRTEGDYFVPAFYYRTASLKSVHICRNGEEVPLVLGDKEAIEKELNGML